MPLHSSLPKEQQQLVFKAAPKGKVKVILATNIAESSVTINDVRVVVDSGLHRERTYDPKSRMTSLDTVWVCQSNAVQRKGRAGRLREGRVFRLYSREQLGAAPWRPVPEIQRCGLAQTCLQAIALRRDPREFLAKALDPPSVEAVEAAMAELALISAIEDGVSPQMLPIGEVLSRMALEPLLGRAMMMGVLFGISEATAALLVVAGGRSPFATPADKRREAFNVKREFCQWSDTIAALKALLKWESILQKDGRQSAGSWARSRFLAQSRLMALSRAKFQLLQDARRSGLLLPESSSKDATMEGDVIQKIEEAYDVDAAGALFEDQQAPDEADFELDDETVWLQDVGRCSPQVAEDPIMPGLLCSAFPMNLAVRRQAAATAHKTARLARAVISPASVNDPRSAALGSVPEGPSWWLYNDLQVSGKTGYLRDTTRLKDWHIGIFAGLRIKDTGGTLKNSKLELDGWLHIQGRSLRTSRLLRKIRQELREALHWQALAASRRESVSARGQAILGVLRDVLRRRPRGRQDNEAP